MKTYELTYIITPEITSEEAGNKAKEIEAIIKTKEGSVMNQTAPVAKTFAYQIGKGSSGFLSVLEFQAEPEKLLEIKDDLSKDKNILRQLITIKKPAKPEKRQRTRIKPEETPKQPVAKEEKTEDVKAVEKAKATDKDKIELKDIDKKLEELFGE